MANQAWLDEVRERLARHNNLPPAYIRRFMEELSDHLQDITEETMSTEAKVSSRLGEPNQVAEAAVAAYRHRSFLGRHPTAAFLVFGVSPVVSQIVLFLVVAVGMRVVGMIAERLGILSNNGEYMPPSAIALQATSYVFSLLFVIVPSILAGILYCKLAERLGIGKKWMFVSCIVLAIMAMLPCWYVRIVADASGHTSTLASLSFPFLCPDWSVDYSHISQLVQLVVPLAIGWWFMRRKRDSNARQLAS